MAKWYEETHGPCPYPDMYEVVPKQSTPVVPRKRSAVTLNTGYYRYDNAAAQQADIYWEMQVDTSAEGAWSGTALPADWSTLVSGGNLSDPAGLVLPASASTVKFAHAGLYALSVQFEFDIPGTVAPADKTAALADPNLTIHMGLHLASAFDANALGSDWWLPVARWVPGSNDTVFKAEAHRVVVLNDTDEYAATTSFLGPPVDVGVLNGYLDVYLRPLMLTS